MFLLFYWYHCLGVTYKMSRQLKCENARFVGGPRLPVAAFIHGHAAQFSARLSLAVAPCKQFALWPFTLCPWLSPPLSLSLSLRLFAAYPQCSAVQYTHTYTRLHATGSPNLALFAAWFLYFVLSFTAAQFPLKLIRFSAGISKEKRATQPPHSTHPSSPSLLSSASWLFPMPHWTKWFIKCYWNYNFYHASLLTKS